VTEFESGLKERRAEWHNLTRKTGHHTFLLPKAAGERALGPSHDIFTGPGWAVQWLFHGFILGRINSAN